MRSRGPRGGGERDRRGQGIDGGTSTGQNVPRVNEPRGRGRGGRGELCALSAVALGLPIHAHGRRGATDAMRCKGLAAPAAAQKPATLVCGCTRCWRMRCSLQRGRDVASTRVLRSRRRQIPRFLLPLPPPPPPRRGSRFLAGACRSRGQRDFRIELRDVLNEKEIAPRGPIEKPMGP